MAEIKSKLTDAEYARELGITVEELHKRRSAIISAFRIALPIQAKKGELAQPILVEVSEDGTQVLSVEEKKSWYNYRSFVKIVF